MDLNSNQSNYETKKVIKDERLLLYYKDNQREAHDMNISNKIISLKIK